MRISKTNCGYCVRSAVPATVLDITIRTHEDGTRSFEYALTDYDKGKAYAAVWDDTLNDFGVPSSYCDIPEEYKMLCEAMTTALHKAGIAISVPYGDYFDDWHLEYDDYNKAVNFDTYKCEVLSRLYYRRGHGNWAFLRSLAYDYYIEDKMAASV